MLDPCWHYFSLLGASWAHFASLAAFVAALGRFLCVLERSGLDFGGFQESPGRVLERPGIYFSRLLRACALAVSACSDCSKTTVLLDRNTVLLGRKTLRKQGAPRKKSRKIAPAAFRTRLPTTVASKMRLGARRARFWRGLGAFRACLGSILGALGQLLGALGSLGRLLDASWAVLVAPGLSWRAPASI